MSSSIVGTLSFTGAHLINPGKNALSADLMAVRGAMFCQGITVEGEVRLLSAHIASQLVFDEAKLLNPGKDALSAQGLVVEGGMHCGSEFHAVGEVNLTGARITHQLNFDGAHLENPGRVALQCQNVETEEIRLQRGFSAVGKVCLSNAQFGTIHDSPADWPDLDLNGMQYKDLDPPLPASERLAWLRKGKKKYRPQPYEQLAAYYRRQGDDVQARRTLQAKQLDRRAGRRWYIRFIEYPLVLVGYGYRPMWAASWMLLLLIVFSILFSVWPPQSISKNQGPPYNAIVYNIDLLLPIINFGHENAFAFKGLGQALPVLIVLVGWILTTAVVAGVARVLTRS